MSAPREPTVRRRLLARAAIAAIAAMLVGAGLAATPATLRAQQPSADARLRQQQEELNRIRREREELQRRMRELQSSVRDLSAEVRNLDRQAEATARLVRSLDEQLTSLTEEVATTTANLDAAESELGAKRLMLRRHARDIYKRGALFEVEALLSADSFGELLARYKYLRELTLRDRRLVREVEGLRDRIAEQRRLMLRLQDEVATNRAERAQEEARLRGLEDQRQRALADTRQNVRRTQQRIDEIARSEARLRNVIASLEAARRRAESRPNAAAPTRSTLRTSDLGKLDWPVEGEIIYRFGRVVNPNNTTTRWNGIGIAAPGGTTVKAIAEGEVVLTEAIGTYGLTVIVQHGGGDYSVYGSLQQASVRVGAQVRKGQTVGTVGNADPDLPAHLHFEIRRDRGTAVDPLEWLRGSR